MRACPLHTFNLQPSVYPPEWLPISLYGELVEGITRPHFTRCHIRSCPQNSPIFTAESLAAASSAMPISPEMSQTTNVVTKVAITRQLTPFITLRK